MNKAKEIELQASYKKSVNDLFGSENFKTDVLKITAAYIHNALAFFKENNVQWDKHEELRLCLETNAHMHLSDVLPIIIIQCLKDLLDKPILH